MLPSAEPGDDYANNDDPKDDDNQNNKHFGQLETKHSAPPFCQKKPLLSIRWCCCRGYTTRCGIAALLIPMPQQVHVYEA